MEPRRSQSDGADGTAAAVDDALRSLARKPLTEAEVARRLAARGHPPAAVATALERLRERGYLNDSELAFDYIVLRAERLGHGPERLIGDLVERGVSPEVAEAAWKTAVDREAVAPVELLRRQIRRRMPGGAGHDRKSRARVYNALLRAGFDGALVRRELETYRVASDPSGEPTGDGMNDDLP